VQRELPSDHPARADAPATAFAPEPSPFDSTPTYAPPSIDGGMTHGPAHGAPAMGGAWSCPMHPEVVSDAPGSCPECGMALKPLAPKASVHGEHGAHSGEPADEREHSGHEPHDHGGGR
jgi:hypothetical protein